MNKRLFFVAVPAILIGQAVHAQSVSNLPPQKLSNEVLNALGTPTPKQSPLLPATSSSPLPVKLLYDGLPLKGDFTLTIKLTRRIRSESGFQSLPVSQTTLFLNELRAETNAVLTLPDQTNGLQVQAALRDENRDLVLETAYALPVPSNKLRILTLTSPDAPVEVLTPSPEFTAVESISGRIILPPKTALPEGSTVHVQLLENALAGGLSLQMSAQDSRAAIAIDGVIPFQLERGVWEKRNDPDLAFKAWISDPMGRKIFVMNKPVGYNGPDIEYTLRMDNLRQGKETKRGRALGPGLMAQTLIQGIAEFDPVNGIPGQARLRIKLSQDRGAFNRNPVIAEQTLLLRGMETRIPFNLTTDSTNFDPYAPAPFLSVSLTDSFGRIYYASGEIRARETDNFIPLYPR